MSAVVNSEVASKAEIYIEIIVLHLNHINWIPGTHLRTLEPVALVTASKERLNTENFI